MFQPKVTSCDMPDVTVFFLLNLQMEKLIRKFDLMTV